MNTQHGDDTSHRLAWAKRAVHDLNAGHAAHGSLAEALDTAGDLRTENAHRRAEAVRAAAMGLPPAACAFAAGISERMLTVWQGTDPHFNAAMAGAHALAHAHGLTDPTAPTSPFALRLLLRAVQGGAGILAAAEQLGIPRHRLQKLRARPQVAALVTAAQSIARKPAPRRSKPYAYRLVRTSPNDGPPTAPRKP
ncbi:hypothetical protein OHA84_03510 [Streptomyces sp. NBC_00513]|uniref:hypothetical protein n=1 Tax=unclassified Streptomyces TaxID=2593676 RepID=UPI0022581B86|nr:hypothetical protein [Streptomyces sp. NBC_00424]MCX5077388.1 hypothetical protein [Streptomyces sp. NBC_00424]WUD39627.1 hypothetical protein OHA84_03510 [Streptomyces sp. NBC_00513]